MLTVLTRIKLLVTVHSEYLGLVFVCQSLILQNTLVNIWKASGMNAPAPSREGWERMAKLQELQKAGTKENRMGEREEKKKSVQNETY